MPSKVAGKEFQFTVRLRKDGENSITGITAVDSSVTPTTTTTPTGQFKIFLNISKTGVPYLDIHDRVVNSTLTPCESEFRHGFFHVRKLSKLACALWLVSCCKMVRLWSVTG